MTTPDTLLRSSATAGCEAGPEDGNGTPAAASAGVAAFFDLDEEAFAVAEAGAVEPANNLRTNGGKSTGNTAVTHAQQSAPVAADAGASGAGAVASPSSAPKLVRNTDAAWLEAEATAGVCRQFDLLLAGGAHSLRTAAQELGRPASFFSGQNSPYAKFKRGGLAALLPARRESVARVMEVPPWFVPAARFFYLLSNRTQYAGSVPDAVVRTISLPGLPHGWTAGYRARFLKALGLDELPACPAGLRDQILERQAKGQPLVTERLHRQILVNASVVKHFRGPRDWSLANQSAPGSQRRFFNRDTCQREMMTPGDWFGGDDATPGIAVCVPCKDIFTPASEKFGVLLGRFQWLAYHDARTDKLLAWDYVVRPRGSYRAEDIVNGMGAVVKTHGVPRQGFQFEGGTWNSKLVRQCIEMLYPGDKLDRHHLRTYSPHQKAIEAVFNKVWTRLAVQFPHADMGRYRNENESNCQLYEACKAGHRDPRRYFPTLDIVVKVFEAEVAAHNARPIKSEYYGRWVPDDAFLRAVSENPLRGFSPEMEWIFSPFSAERTVRGMLVKCRVPMFEDLSIPFEFGSDWMPQYSGQRVRLHFNPRHPKCVAKVVLAATGEILGDATLLTETTGYIRYILEWGDDDQRAGYLQRQRVGNFVRRETRGIGAGGRVEYAKSEERDGISTISKIEKNQAGGVQDGGSGDPSARCSASPGPVDDARVHNSRAGRLESPQPAPLSKDTAASRRAELEALTRQTDHLFV
jgi:hypothetical protein